MGQTFSKEELNNQTAKIKFIDLINDKNYGMIRLYQTVISPYEYIMDYKKIFIEQQPKAKSYKTIINQLAKNQHKNIVKIHWWQQLEESHLCLKEKAIHIYANYYNFSLSDTLNTKKKKNQNFNQGQILYILSSLVSISIHLKSIGLVFGLYRNDRIFLSPQGHIKVYVLDVEEDNKHSSYYKAISDNNLILKEILSPQQLKYIKNHNLNLNFNIQKSDVFAIAIIILQLLSLDSFKYYFNVNKKQWNSQRILYDLNSYKENYNQQLINLIIRCLSQNDSKRPSLEQIRYCIQMLAKESQNNYNSIKLNTTQNFKPKNNRDSKESNRISIMQSLDKLNVVKIETLKSSMSNKSTAQNWLSIKDSIKN